jgi:aminopeptidase N
MRRAPRPLALALAAACVAALVAAAARAQEGVRDPHSFARPDDVAVTHLALDLTVDFAARRLVGSAELTVERREPGAEALLLDTRDLEIESVTVDDRAEPVAFRLAEPLPILGRALAVPLGADTKKVTVRYRTRPGAAALQWLEPAQTAGGRRPFLFTQSQPILARTWVPCQDSPAVRATYTATVRVPPDLLAVMSATNPQAKRGDGVYRFAMDRPIPSYLLALAVGDLEFRALGPRTGVYAEPPVAAAAAWELADTEAMMAATEKLYGPYRWGRYDLLVLPPSFPFGGMENPRLTFATPTILAGDRSLVSLVAHELAHSWSGNLVTNATWNDFWLNEGFTTYIESRIVEALYGADRAAMLRELARREIDDTLARLGPASRASWLYGDLSGRDPDDYEGAIAYDKGALFLETAERLAGRARWDAWLRGYFERHAFRSISTHGFLADLGEHLLAENRELAEQLAPEAWIFGPGVPANAASSASRAFEAVDRELARFRSGALAADLATDGWVTQQWQRFLRNLGPQPADRLADLDALFGFTRSGNSEVLCDWLQLAIAAGYEPAFPALERFLTSVGRRKFLRPLYGALAQTPAGLARARSIYAKARPGYHSVSRRTIDEIVGFKE